MRKSRFKLIKKTERWLHRKKGTDTLSIPTDIDTDRISRFVILGGEEYASDGTMSGVGDYDTGSGSYVIDVHAHGTNYLSGTDFANIHLSKNISTATKPSLSASSYIFVPDADTDGTVIIGRDVIKFKETTAYTIAFTVKYLTNTKPKDLKLTFNYTDGTSYTPTFDTTAKSITGCVSSDPQKTIAYISSYVGDRKATNYTLSDFGLYEGVYANHADVHVPYTGERSRMILDAPLYSIGYASDELDLRRKALLRKIRKMRIDHTSEIDMTDGAFRIPLDAPARVGSRIVCSGRTVCDVSLSEDGEALVPLFPVDITETSEARSYLLDNPFDVYYILREPDVYTADISCPNLLGSTAVELFCNIAPRKFFVEYY